MDFYNDMPISKAETFAIFTNKIKCVDHNWSKFIIGVNIFSLHQMESIFVHTLRSSEMNEKMMQYTKEY